MLTIEPLPRRLHGGDGETGAQEHTGGVHLHDAVPARRLEGVGHRRAAQPGVVDQHIQLAETLHRGADRLFPIVLAGHVQGHEHRLAAAAANVRLDLSSLVLKKVRDDHLGALAGEKASLLGTHAARGPADQCHFTC